MRALTSVAVVVACGLLACGNPCQRLCGEMAAYAEECGFTLGDDELKQCRDDFQKDAVAEEDLAVCSDFSSALREEWSCEDVAFYGLGG